MQVGPEKSKTSLFAISGSSKFIVYTNIRKYVTGSIFIVIWFFFNARNNVLYQNQQQLLKSPKNTYLWLNDPHDCIIIKLVGNNMIW